MAASTNNFGPPVKLAETFAGSTKTLIVSVLGPAQYATNGAELDLSSDATDGFGNIYDAFKEAVYSVKPCGVAAVAGGAWRLTYVPAANGAVATGKIYVQTLLTDPTAELANASTALAAVTFYLEITGR